MLRLLRALVGYNLCFFKRHHWEWVERYVWDANDCYAGTRSYQRCSRCRTVNLKTQERFY